MVQGVTYMKEGRPIVCWPGFYTDEDGTEHSYLSQLVSNLPDGAEYALVTEEEAEAWVREHTLLEQARADRLARIDAETSAAILAGFDYEVKGKILHFSYDVNDQQNFSDTANASILARIGAPGVPSSVTWNGWDVEKDEDGAETGRTLVRLDLDPDSFLALYMGGALVHKASRMESGGRRKAAAEAAQSLEELNAI